MQELEQVKIVMSNIKQFRLDSKMSQVEIAKKLYIPQSEYSNLENVKQIPTLYTLLRILNVLNIDFELKRRNNNERL